MPDALYRNTSQQYPGFNMNVPDQFRASQFYWRDYGTDGDGKLLYRRFCFIHLPNDSYG